MINQNQLYPKTIKSCIKYRALKLLQVYFKCKNICSKTNITIKNNYFMLIISINILL